MIYNFKKAAAPVLFGPQSSLQIGQKAKEHGVTKALCMYDKGIKSTGIAAKVVNSLNEAGIEVVEFDGVLADPPDTMVNEAAKLAIDAGVDGIVAVGGGSSMDAAKAVNVAIGNGLPISRFYNGEFPLNPGKPLLLIPTTAGTGSEVTVVSVITDTTTELKKGVVGPATSATLAIIDPELMLGLPPAITASTGMDAFSHAFDAYTASVANPHADILAEKALCLIVENIVAAVENGSDINVRSNMAFASMLGGMAFDSSMCQLPHAIAHLFGSKHHIPHGIACALAMPPVIEFICDVVPQKIRNIGRFLGLDLDDNLTDIEVGKVVSDGVSRLNRRIGIPGVKSFNLTDADLEKLVQPIMEDGVLFFSPKPTSPDDVRTMLKKVYQYE